MVLCQKFKGIYIKGAIFFFLQHVLLRFFLGVFYFIIYSPPFSPCRNEENILKQCLLVFLSFLFKGVLNAIWRSFSNTHYLNCNKKYVKKTIQLSKKKSIDFKINILQNLRLKNQSKDNFYFYSLTKFVVVKTTYSITHYINLKNLEISLVN